MGKWLLGVSGGYEGEELTPCGHTFSEMELYNEAAAIDDAEAVVKNIKEYWKNQGNQAEEENKKSGFLGFVLLSENNWDKDRFFRDLKEEWDISVDEVPKAKDQITVFSIDGVMATVGLIPQPIPDDEAVECAKTNYMWNEAVDTAKAHKAHLIVAVLGGNYKNDKSAYDLGKLHVKLVSACCRQAFATGVYANGTVYEPKIYRSFADMMKEGNLPLFNWVWIGMYEDKNGVSCYTIGMEVFGKNEMEVLNAKTKRSEVYNFMVNMIAYVLENDVTLKNGETIGFSPTDKHAITFGKGVAMTDINTLKIKY